MGEISAEAVAAFIAAGVAALALGCTGLSVMYLARQTQAVARQTRALAEQTETGNAMAAVAANASVLDALRQVHLLILERPGARRYFYDGAQPPAQQDQRDEIFTIAELLADVMSSGTHAHMQVPGSTSADPWDRYCRHLLRNSPALSDLVREHPGWWPYLPPLLPPAEAADNVAAAAVTPQSGPETIVSTV